MQRNPFTGELIREEPASREELREARRARARTRRDRLRLAREIIAWDGEGLAADDGAAQPYVLLANSAGARWTDLRGLGSARCLEALLQGAREHPGARHVAFGISYDVNQWLRELPESTLHELYREGACWWHDYRIEYRPRRSFYVKRMATGERVTIYDVQTWYGLGLAEALARWLPGFSGISVIARMKARRRLFHARELDAIERYCALELSATVALTRELLERLTDLEIRPPRLDGPGSAAAAMLGSAGVKEHMGELESDMERAALGAYVGGRIELLQYGAHRGAVHEYDLHGAYAWAMQQLPSLAGARWRYVAGADHALDDWTLYRVRWVPGREAGEGRSRYYPFAWRDTNGGIFFPSAGEAWIWGPEYAAYLETRDLYDCRVEVVGAFVAALADRDTRPFAFMRDLFRTRSAAAGAGATATTDVAAGLIKAVMVACYGKLVQAVGWRDKPPPYYSIAWGGLVTSYIRAELLRAAALDPEAVIMFTTDGLYTTRKLAPPRGVGPALGQWGYTRYTGITAAQSGIYVLERTGGKLEAVTRGYSPRDLSPVPARAASMLRDMITEGWAAGAQTVTIPQTRFISLASWQELAPGPPAWRSWVREHRALELWPAGKRTGGAGDPARGLVASAPMPVVENLRAKPRMSTVYSRTWALAFRQQSEGIAPALEEEIEEAVL